MTKQEMIKSLKEFIADAKKAYADRAYKMACPIDHAAIPDMIARAEDQLSRLGA